MVKRKNTGARGYGKTLYPSFFCIINVYLFHYVNHFELLLETENIIDMVISKIKTGSSHAVRLLHVGAYLHLTISEIPMGRHYVVFFTLGKLVTLAHNPIRHSPTLFLKGQLSSQFVHNFVFIHLIF